jgi:hypothetical protein
VRRPWRPKPLPYAYGLVRFVVGFPLRRVIIYDALEITCTHEKAGIIADWLVECGAASRTSPLPVPEYVHPPGRSYGRWTIAAEAVYTVKRAREFHASRAS